MQLSKDRNLEEREKLQLQLTDMNYKMQQQQETIQVTFNIYFQKLHLYENSRNKIDILYCKTAALAEISFCSYYIGNLPLKLRA